MDMWMIVALLGVVIFLYASMLPNREKPKPAPVQEDFLDSVGETLQHFADELEEENQELLSMIGEMKRDHEARTNALLTRIEQLEKRADSAMPSAAAVLHPRETGESLNANAVARAPAFEAEPPQPAAASPSAETKTSRLATTVRERHREVFELYNDGKSMEYIARKLGKNKGEIQLIISLARQEEPQHDET